MIFLLFIFIPIIEIAIFISIGSKISPLSPPVSESQFRKIKIIIKLAANVEIVK